MAYYATAFELFDGSIGHWMPRCEQMTGRWSGKMAEGLTSVWGSD